MAGGYLGNIYNSPINHSKSRNMGMDTAMMNTAMMNTGIYSDADTFLNMETNWFDQKKARYMIVSALAIMLISSMTSNIDNKLVILLSIISFIISGLIAVGGVIYLIIAAALNNQQSPNTTQPSSQTHLIVDKFMNSNVGIIVGSSLGAFVIVSIASLIASVYIIRSMPLNIFSQPFVVFKNIKHEKADNYNQRRKKNIININTK